MGLSDKAMITLADIGAFTDGNIPNIGTPTTATKEQLIESASATIVRTCNREFMKQSYSERYRGNNESGLYLNHKPVISIDSITINGTEIDADDYYIVDKYSGLIELESTTFYDSGLHDIVIEYDAGYIPVGSTATDDEDVYLPADLYYACCLEVNRLLTQAGDRYNMPLEASDKVKDILKNWRKYDV